MKKLIYILLLFFFLPISANAATYYVCASETDCDSGAAGNTDWVTGNDSNNGTSRATPWLTASYALEGSSPVAAGDTVIFGKGEWDEAISLRVTGSSGNRLTIRGETLCTMPPDDLTGTCESKLTHSTAGSTITFIAGNVCEYIDFYGLDISGGTHSIAMNGDQSGSYTRNNIRFIQCKIHENLDRAFYGSCIAGGGGYSHTITVDRVEFYGCGTGCGAWTNCNIGSSANGSGCDAGDSGSNKPQGYSIYLTGTNWIVRNSIFRDPANCAGFYIKVDGYDDSMQGTYDPEVRIYNNVFSGYRSSALPGEKFINQIMMIGPGGNNGKEVPNRETIISNNAFHDVASSSAQCTAADPAVCLDDTGCCGYINPWNNKVKFYNNRSDGELWGEDDDVYDPTPEVLSGNLDESDGWSGSSFGFTSVGNNNYSHSGQTANMVDSGNTTYYAQRDITNANRDALPDIGPHEYLIPPEEESKNIRYSPGAGGSAYSENAGALEFIAP